ncbi:MFS transporter [Pseudokineococcus lusitanus]|uniref:Putative MFS family arabinose efflux permease n=1 Tax=Pseudokineococcus lusitanus TaxID=763993 RepID=A0A3N1GAL0_9ACTN|nr:MFS transporter [Pseudokineococcus lusitanus]ROP27270.1 putative MFS family arabinose efflux permease [Pseudokineococcus lusitanus]
MALHRPARPAATGGGAPVPTPAGDAPPAADGPPAEGSSSLLDQPRAVWAVAFACVIAFMGIGLVDPILKPIGEELDASPSQVSLLFTSYMAVTGVAMLVTGVISSRVGPKRTLLGGLAVIVVFSALAGSSGSIGEIVGFRAGWGLGNALFIATALATIVGAASGGVAGAIVLYEAALGVGIATGPLLGGLLGGVSWRGPFFGVAVLMAVAFAAIAVFLPEVPRPARATTPLDPFRALRHRGLLAMAVTALLYNVGFFTLLAYTPFPLDLGIYAVGGVFFGWGVCLALSSVFLAPWLQRRVGTLPGIVLALVLFALDLAVMALFTDSKAVLATCVVVAGVFLGVNNTLVTEGVMLVSPAERSTASAAYSFVRFGGGAVAPWLAGRLGESISPHVPFWVGAGAVLLGVVVLTGSRRHLGRLSGVGHGATPAAHGRTEVAAVSAAEAS